MEVVDPYPKLTRFKAIMEAPDAFDFGSRAWVSAGTTALEDALAEALLTDRSLTERVEQLPSGADEDVRARAILAMLDNRHLTHQLRVFGRRFMELREEFRDRWDR